eukprot:3625667-Amphidinium_carterae.8
MQTPELQRASQQPRLRVMSPEDQELQRVTEIARTVDSYFDDEPTKCWAKSCAVPGTSRYACQNEHLQQSGAQQTVDLATRRNVCCQCGKDNAVVGCMFEGCDHYRCSEHALKIDGEGSMDKIG